MVSGTPTEETDIMDLSLTKADNRFALPPWTVDSPEWQALDRRLAADHQARVIAGVVQELDCSSLEELYHGVGSKAHHPELMLKIALYETVEGRLSPAAWARDAQESYPVQWLAMGIQPCRSAMYNFRTGCNRPSRRWSPTSWASPRRRASSELGAGCLTAP
jgi:transposase